MTNTSARNRQSAGQPTGGQFATEAKSADTGVDLGDRSRRVYAFDRRAADFISSTRWPDGITVEHDQGHDAAYVSHVDTATRSRSTAIIRFDPYDASCLDRDKVLDTARDKALADSRNESYTAQARALSQAMAGLIDADRRSEPIGEEQGRIAFEEQRGYQTWRDSQLADNPDLTEDKVSEQVYADERVARDEARYEPQD